MYDREQWDGESKLLSRYGKKLPAPLWFTEKLPNIPLDGELWIGRGLFEQLSSILKSRDSMWNEVGYYLFDLPASRDPYEVKIVKLEALKPLLPSHVHIVENISCKGIEHLKEHLESILEVGGEGLIVREPKLPYALTTITNSLLKVKV